MTQRGSLISNIAVTTRAGISSVTAVLTGGSSHNGLIIMTGGGDCVIIEMICIVAADILNGALCFTGSCFNNYSLVGRPDMMAGSIAFLHAAAFEAIITMSVIAIPVVTDITVLIEDAKIVSTIDIVQVRTPDAIIPEIDTVSQFPPSVIKGFTGFTLYALLPVRLDQLFGVTGSGMLMRAGATLFSMYMTLGTQTMGIHFRCKSRHRQHAQHQRECEDNAQ